MPPGRVLWLGIAPSRRAPIQAVAEVLAVQDVGLDGDRHARAGRRRQVTLVLAADLERARAALGRPVPPEATRRNVLVGGLDPSALTGAPFRIGQAVLQVVDTCDPCDRMDQTLGPGGRAALEGRGGFAARVLVGGRIALGDPVVPLPEGA